MMRRSRKHPKPFCAYTLLARVFFWILRSAKLSIRNDFVSQWGTELSWAAFLQSYHYAPSIFLKLVLRKMVKTQKAADRDFSGALFNQNFPYSTKNLTRSFSFKLVKMRCGFHARDFHSLGGALFLKTVLKHKKFFGRIRPSWLSSCAAILLGGSWKRFLKGPSFHTDFWAFFVCALTVWINVWAVSITCG